VADEQADTAVGTPWWRDAVVYQIYPRSFAESPTPGATRRGVGNLRGILERLDHLAWLGVDAIWISPIFRSPMADFGYDISDHCDVDPLFGTLADADELIAAAHERGIRVLLDFVPNHTSDEHPWFVESRSSRDNCRAHWYVWRDDPANNWLAALRQGIPAWTLDGGRGQYYLHCFLPQQPDLNWDEPAVEAAMLDVLRFWLDRGVDGFRMDVIHLIAKHIDRDDPPEAVARGHDHVTYNDVPEVHPRLRTIRRVLDAYPGDRVAVGEVYLLDEARMAAYYGHGDELNLSFNFRFLWSPFTAADLEQRIARTVAILGARDAWPTWVLSNHDAPRQRTRFGGSETAARMAAALLLTLPGTPFLYQGEELGLLDAVVPPSRAVDPGGRDGSRAPIPWTGDADGGWGPTPWLPLPPESDVRNVASQRADEGSILHWYRRLLALRRATPALRRGSFRLLDGGADVLCYERSLGGERWFALLAFADAEVVPPAEMAGAEVVATTDPAASADIVHGPAALILRR
jgi:alpha-glucosidase